MIALEHSQLNFLDMIILFEQNITLFYAVKVRVVIMWYNKYERVDYEKLNEKHHSFYGARIILHCY